MALLSGINVGKRRISMTSLADCFENYGFSGVRTYIASGNVSFDSKLSPAIDELQNHFSNTFGFDSTIVILSLSELDELLDRVSNTLIGQIDKWHRPLVDPKIESSGDVVAVGNGKHSIDNDAKVARVELLESYERGSLWRWTIADGKPPASMEKLFLGKTTTRFAHTLEKIYANASGAL